MAATRPLKVALGLISFVASEGSKLIPSPQHWCQNLKGHYLAGPQDKSIALRPCARLAMPQSYSFDSSPRGPMD
eukprot:648050-Amorphochlora_amoeboformis.AAC.1